MSNKHTFGSKSTAKLETCAPRLRGVAIRALELTPYDFTILVGFRSQADQDAAVKAGNSRTPFPESKHNSLPSQALDFAPWIDGDIPWKDTHIFAVIAGAFLAAAEELGTPIRWGGDWDSDGKTSDQTLMDWGHIELA